MIFTTLSGRCSRKAELYFAFSAWYQTASSASPLAGSIRALRRPTAASRPLTEDSSSRFRTRFKSAVSPSFGAMAVKIELYACLVGIRFECD